jgi:hypothetical protein
MPLNPAARLPIKHVGSTPACLNPLLVETKEWKMNKIIERATLLIAGAGIATSVFMVTAGSPAHAATGQYKVVQIFDVGQLELQLNGQSAQGWTYVGSNGMALIFKH